MSRIWWCCLSLFAASAVRAESPGSPSRFPLPQITRVALWLDREVPECPGNKRPQVVERTLLELSERRPALLGGLGDLTEPTAEIRATILRQVASRLDPAASAQVREHLALRRIAETALAEQIDLSTVDGPAGVLERLRTQSEPVHRRLLLGTLDYDPLVLTLRRLVRPAAPAPTAAPLEETAEFILGEFARRNQEGAASDQLRSLIIVATFRPQTGGEQKLIVLKARPDRFRVVAKAEGRIVSQVLGDSGGGWSQENADPFRPLTPEAIEARRYLRQFLDPVLMRDVVEARRLPDGVVAERPVFRIDLTARDGSRWIACIDRSTYRLLARELPRGDQVLFSDHRDAAGVTLPFREEYLDREGRRAVLQIERVVANPGLVSEVFAPAGVADLNYLRLESWRGEAQAQPKASPEAKR